MAARLAALSAALVICSGASVAADLAGRRAAPQSDAPASAPGRCLETNDLSPDVFGFTQGSDVADFRSWSVTTQNDGGATARGTRLNGGFSILQLSGGILPCMEIGPYGYLGRTTARERSGDGGRSNYAGGGFEVKYKLLGRDTHGVGLTFDATAEYQNGKNTGLLGPNGSLGGSAAVFGVGGAGSYNLGARLFMDRVIIPGVLFAALNVEHQSAYSTNLALAPNASQFNARAALSAKVSDSVFVGFEGLYSRSYSGAGYEVYQGDGWFVGPNMVWALNDKWTFNAAYQVQVAGSGKGQPGTLNLVQYNLHTARMKLNYQF